MDARGIKRLLDGHWLDGRWVRRVFAMLLLIGCWPSGCASRPAAPAMAFGPKTPVVRVLLMSGQTSVALTMDRPPTVKPTTYESARRVDVPPGTTVPLTITPAGWQLGGAVLAAGDLLLTPESDGTVAVNRISYRGKLRFVRRGNNTFDVVNDVDVESYLKGVLPKELLPEWTQPEAYKAQAVAARTYAIYEVQTTRRADFDLFDDERSQVYGGMTAENGLSRQAVDDTAGWVVAAGPVNQEKIFKTYFSACCGGAGQSAADAFGDAPTPQLSATSAGNLCMASPRFNWMPVSVSKRELTDRFRHFGRVHDAPLKDVGNVLSIDIAEKNVLGRPVKFTVTDDRHRRYTLSAEQTRQAINTDARVRVFSSYFRPENGPDMIHFVDGHGFGHGVGLCQWCTEIRASQGMGYEQIVRLSYPGAILVHAY